MSESTVTSKGQTTVPASVRESMGAVPGTRLVWPVQPAHLLSAHELSFESEKALGHALLLWQRGRADFSDCLQVALTTQAGEQPLWTFDRRVASLPGAEMPG